MAKSFASIILVLVLYISLPYASPEFEKYEGMDCTGSLADILRDFVGTASQCKAKCAELDGCVGFVRLNSKGQCYFRGGTLNDPTPTPYGDDRDCYEVILTPRHDMIIVDENYDRIPSQNNLIGTMDVLDEIYVEFDIVIHSWPGNGTFYQIIDIEQTAVIYIYDPNEAFFLRSFGHGYVPSNEDLRVNTSYHLTLYRTQEHISITVNDVKLVDEAQPYHPVAFNRNIWFSNPQFNAATTSTISNLFISTSNSDSPHKYNYLCDADLQFEVTSGGGQGHVVFNTSQCTMHFYDNTSWWSAVWMGNDTSTILWTDYTLEVAFTIHTTHLDEETNGRINILFRTQDATMDDKHGYNLEIFGGSNSFQGSNSIFGAFLNGNPRTDIVRKTTNIWEYNTTYTVRIEAIGSLYTFYRNDEFLFNGTDTTFMSGSIGVSTTFAEATIEYIRITFESDNTLLYSSNPTINPSYPTHIPTTTPSGSPSTPPSNAPSNAPSQHPSVSPSIAPTSSPSTPPSIAPSSSPSTAPSLTPSSPPSTAPSVTPTSPPSLAPSLSPTICYENGNQISDDGFELSVYDMIQTLQFNNEINDAMRVNKTFAIHGQSFIFVNQLEAQVICEAPAACHGGSGARFSFSNMSTCNVLCNEPYACYSRSVHIDDCQNSEIICNGTHSCEYMKVSMHSSSNDVLNVY
eukprot:280496_1